MSSALDIVIRANDAGASRILAGVQSSLKGITGFGSNLLLAPFRGIAGPLGAAVAGFASVGAAVSFVKGALAEAAENETFTAKLRAITGSATEAKKRLEELEKLKLETPFDTPELVAAETSLARFTNNAWHGVEALKLCGELATATGQGIESMSQMMGRVYAEIQSGVAGRGLASLQISGVIDPKTKKDIEAMIEKGEKGDVVWQKLTGTMTRFGGNMAAQMSTSAGKMSLLAKMWEDVQQEFGTPILDGLSPLLDQIKTYLPQVQAAAKSAGESVATILQMATNAFANGRFGEFVMRSIVLGIQYAGGSVLALFADWAMYLGKAAKAAIEAATEATKDSVADTTARLYLKATGNKAAIAELDREKSVGWLENFSVRLSKLATNADLNGGPKSYVADGMKDVLAGKWQEMVKDFFPKLEAVKKADETTPPPKANPGIEHVDPKSKKPKAKEEQTRFADSYSRIGLFVGGAGVNYQSSIAKNTERANKLLEQTNNTLVRIADNAGTGSVAVWA